MMFFQSDFSPKSVTPGNLHPENMPYLKYFCIVPIIAMAATDLSTSVVVVKLGRIHSWSL
jgi:hypothetical protein